MTGLLTDISFMYAHLRLRNFLHAHYWTKKYKLFPLYLPDSVILWAGNRKADQRENLERTYEKMIFYLFYNIKLF
jgi:hypothetical protein